MPDPIRIAQTAAATMRAVHLPSGEVPSSAAGNPGPNWPPYLFWGWVRIRPIPH